MSNSFGVLPQAIHDDVGLSIFTSKTVDEIYFYGMVVLSHNMGEVQHEDLGELDVDPTLFCDGNISWNPRCPDYFH